MTEIDGATVLITGAGGGLGRQWVDQVLSRGAIKVYAATRSGLEWEDPRVFPLRLDVTDENSLAEAAAIASDANIVVNNAGIPLYEPISIVSPDKLRQVFDVNFFGAVAVARHFSPHLKTNGGGAVVNVLSVLSWYARSGGYSAAKAALWSATNSLRLELLSQGTHVLALHMGYVDTPMTAGIEVPKSGAGEIIRAALDGLEAGENEVLADDIARKIRGRLSEPLTALYPELAVPNS